MQPTPTDLYTLSLHDALPISSDVVRDPQFAALESIITLDDEELGPIKMQNVLFRMLGTPGRVRWSGRRIGQEDRKSTRLNSSHSQISYAVFCLKKKSLA